MLNFSKKIGCGGRIRTFDLRVMSPTSYLTAPPRDILHIYIIINGGGGGTRTYDPPGMNRML